MAVLTAAQDLDLLSRPYDVQDPSAPDPSHPRVARVPGTVDRGGVSIFGGEGQVPGDDLDALFNDDHDITEPFRETVDFNQSVPMHLEDDEDSQAAAAAARRAAYAQEDRARDLDEPAPQGLGIDEEVKVRKPRAPIAKLDHDRLLGEKGIPKLQKIAKTKLKFRGKGHEVRVLRTWCLREKQLTSYDAVLGRRQNAQHVPAVARRYVSEGALRRWVVDHREAGPLETHASHAQGVD